MLAIAQRKQRKKTTPVDKKLEAPPELEADAPWLGSTWQVQLTNLPPASFALLAAGLSTTTWAGGSLPFDLGAFGLTGCFLHVSPDSSTLLGITGGTATLTTTLPNSASLAGATLNYQGFALDPGVNPAGAIVTNAATATFAML